ncbi:hypothetical protein F4774DRAFT_22890 [Daldinia eschscholtzii]|nr:hypothetical protein F4774DRAFT_22890 [Daldinia eschscholtzii]
MQSQRRKKACKECRTHKIKCSAEPPEICSRCRRLRLSCVLTSDTRSRQTKAQLQRELEALKSLVKQPTQLVQDSNPALTYIPGQHQANIETPAFPGPLLCSSEQIHVVSFPDTTCSPRILDGQELSSSEISHCFKL